MMLLTIIVASASQNPDFQFQFLNQITLRPSLNFWNKDAVRYLGEIFNSKGNNNDLIDPRVKMGKKKFGLYMTCQTREN